jgi:short-subunit dehydrogenase
MLATLITGASGGIGLAYARLAAKDGENVVLVARSKSGLDAVATELRNAYGVDVTVMAEDLIDAGAVERIVTALKERNITIDALVNNAGVGKLAPFADTDAETIDTMLTLNIRAVTQLTRALLPGMIERKRGRIVNVASTAAFQPGPLMAVYYATKAYVMNWSLALGLELEHTGVTVTCLCPGPTSTGFQNVAGMNNAAMFKSRFVMTAEDVARIGRRAALRGTPLVVTGRRNSFFAFCTRLIPRTIAGRIARRLQGSALHAS